MAVAFVASRGTGNRSGNTTTTATLTGAVAAGNDLIISAGRFCSTPTSTMSASAPGLTVATDRDSGNGQVRAARFRIRAPAGGIASGTVITITHSSASDCIVAADEYSGIDGTSPVRAVNSGTGSTAGHSSGSVAGSSGDGLIGHAFIDNGATTASTPTSPGVEREDVHVGAQSETLTVIDKLSVSGSDSIAGTWDAAGTWAAVAVAYAPAAGGGTPVTASRGLSYDVLNSVQAARGLSYDVQAQVQASRALSYDVANAVQAARALSYDVANSVVAARALSYDLIAFLAAARALSYDITAGVAPSNTVAPAITDDGTPQTGETVSVDTGTWTGDPTITYTYQWKRDFGTGPTNIIGATSSSYTLSGSDEGTDVWCTVTATNDFGSASADSNVISPTGAATTVQAARGLSYDVLNAVTAARALNYDVLNALQASRALSYDVLNAVLAQRALSYDLLNAVQAQRGLVYDVGDVVIPAGATRQGLWLW